MLVAIEVSAAMATRRTGVGHYTAHLMDGLETIRGDDVEFVYFANHPATINSGGSAMERSNAFYPRNTMRSRLLWLQFGVPRSMRQIAPDVSHFPNQLLPIFGRRRHPTVVTIHDAAIYRSPQTVQLKTLAIHRALLAAARHDGAMVVTPTCSVRDEIIERLSLPADRVHAIAEGVDPQFNPRSGSDDQQIIERYALHAPYVLIVATLEPRKNHRRLVDAFTHLVQQEHLPHHLVIVGARGWKDSALRDALSGHPLAGRIHVLGYVPTAHLPALYRRAAAFAFPSLYEGFGLPALEALACGTPTLISNDSALCEVAAGSAVIVDPLSITEIAHGLYRLITDEPLRARLRTLGLQRAGELTWSRCARETMQLYRAISVQA